MLRKNDAIDRKTPSVQIVEVPNKAIKSTLGGSGPIHEVYGTGGTRYG